jgi:hypothetical protein
LDATEAHQLSPAMSQRTVRATGAALGALIEGQDQMAIKAHLSIEKVGRQLGLTETSWGEGAPKPAMAMAPEMERDPV